MRRRLKLRPRLDASNPIDEWAKAEEPKGELRPKTPKSLRGVV